MSAKIKTVYTLPDSVLINETTTDEHGEFAFTNLQSVNKMLKFSVDGYKEISFRALPEQNVKLRGDQIIVTTFFKKSLNPQTSTSFLNG